MGHGQKPTGAEMNQVRRQVGGDVLQVLTLKRQVSPGQCGWKEVEIKTGQVWTKTSRLGSANLSHWEKEVRIVSPAELVSHQKS